MLTTHSILFPIEIGLIPNFLIILIVSIEVTLFMLEVLLSMLGWVFLRMWFRLWVGGPPKHGRFIFVTTLWSMLSCSLLNFVCTIDLFGPFFPSACHTSFLHHHLPSTTSTPFLFLAHLPSLYTHTVGLCPFLATKNYFPPLPNITFIWKHCCSVASSGHCKSGFQG